MRPAEAFPNTSVPTKSTITGVYNARMCLLVLAWKTHPDYPLIFAGNRDERHARPSLAAGFWDDVPQVLAGRDLEAGGTWLGVTTGGRFAVVTNYREGLNPKKMPRSRGALTADFLNGFAEPQFYLRDLRQQANEYAPFSLIVGDTDELWYFSNRSGQPPQPINPGIHGLSNHLLDTPWPKVVVSKSRLATLLEHDAATQDALLTLLADRNQMPAEHLPDTGIGPERERMVSPVFVTDPAYGTRCSSVIFLRQGDMRFAERRFGPSGRTLETRTFHLTESA